METLMGLLGLTPEQVAQYGIAGILAIVLLALIGLMAQIAKNSAANDKSRNTITEQSLVAQKEMANAITETRITLASAFQSFNDGQRQTVLFVKGLIDAVVASGNDSVDAIDGVSRTMMTKWETAQRELTAIVDNSALVTAAKVSPIVRETVASGVDRSVSNQNENRDDIKDHIDIAEKGLHLRIDLGIQDLGMRLDNIIARLNAFPTMIEHKEVMVELTAIKNELTAPVPPSLDTIPTQAAAAKHKTQPIPELPPAMEAVLVETVKQLQAELPPELPIPPAIPAATPEPITPPFSLDDRAVG